MDREQYNRIKDYLEVSQCFYNEIDLFKCKTIEEIGEKVYLQTIYDLGITVETFKEFLMKRGFISSQEFEVITEEDIFLILIRYILKMFSLPRDELTYITGFYSTTLREYTELIDEISHKISQIDNLIKIDSDNPQKSGSLILKQRQIYSINARNKNLLKDLKKFEEEILNSEKEIQEKYIYQKTLKHILQQLEELFKESIFMENSNNSSHILKKIAFDLAQTKEETLKKYHSLNIYKEYIEIYSNISTSLYKPFFITKMRKFYNDLTEFSNLNQYKPDYNDKLSEKIKKINEIVKDSDNWINLKNTEEDIYLKSLKKCITEYQVLDYLTKEINSLFCIRYRASILSSIIDLFQNKDYLLFINLIVIQIEGLFNDLFLDITIQKRLNGHLDLFQNDDLKTKFSKTQKDLDEATLYYKYYFNNIRNQIAHGKGIFDDNEIEIMANELLLDFQYVINLISIYSETNNAVKYIRMVSKQLNLISTSDNKFRYLLNLLNGNTIISTPFSIAYNNSDQDLFRIFNPYYTEVYEFTEIIETRDELINQLTSIEFWNYVNQELLTHTSDNKIFKVKINRSFLSRLKAIKSYIAQNKKYTLSIIVKVENNLNDILRE